MIIHRFNPSVTTAGGEWSSNTLKLNGCLCQQVYLKSASDDTTFDLSILDKNDIEIRKITSVSETVNDLTPFPCEGMLTVAISNATADEAFTVLLCFIENY